MQASGSDNSPFFLYVLECADGTWYTGYTVDVDERLRAHNAGAGAKYTRSRRPVRLLAQAAFATKHEAMSAEYRFKRLTRRQKERLVRRAACEPFEHVLRVIVSSVPASPDEASNAEGAEGGAVA